MGQRGGVRAREDEVSDGHGDAHKDGERPRGLRHVGEGGAPLRRPGQAQRGRSFGESAEQAGMRAGPIWENARARWGR